MSELPINEWSEKPIRIAGGGLAGLSLGVGLARQGIAVELSEAGDYPRHRVCGEFISGVSKSTLESLGIAGCLDDAVSCQTTAWFDGVREISRRQLPEPALGISRYRLDARLVNALREAGGTVHTKVRERLEEWTATAENRVLASGRVRQRGNWVGIKSHFLGLDMEADLEMHLGRDGYLGLAKIEEGRTNACGLFRVGTGDEVGRDLAELCQSRGLTELAARMRCGEPDPESFCSVAGIGFGWQRGDQELSKTGPLVVGDRLALIPPFTGNGMTMAFQSAELALESLLAGRASNARWGDMVDNYSDSAQKRFGRRLGIASALHPALVNPGGQGTLSLLSRSQLLPFSLLYRLLR